MNSDYRVANTHRIPWRAASGGASCRLFFAKEPLLIGLFCGGMTYEDKASYGSWPTCSREWMVALL